MHSAASDRSEYLRRPDLGRQLNAQSQSLLCAQTGLQSSGTVFVVADGLSAIAVEHHAAPLLQEVRERLPEEMSMPVVLAEQARVALGDPIGAELGAEIVVVLIGERPGLSAPDSLGAYTTYGPRAGRTDAERNCVSNIRPQGLSYATAARTICHLLAAARRLRLSGVHLKDESGCAELY
jgi:ethanolamine ammonia-lyase small subunit